MFSQNQSQYPTYVNNKSSFYTVSQSSRNQYNKWDPKNYQLDDPSFSDYRTSIDTQSQYSFNKKKASEQLNNIIINMIENTIPKIADHCANVILQKIGPNFKKETEEIGEIDQEINVINKNVKKNQENNKLLVKKEVDKFNKQVKEFSNFYEKNEVKPNKAFIKKMKNNTSGFVEKIEELKDKFNDVNNQMQIDSESISSNLEKCINEKKANVILMKKQIDDKVLPLEIVIDNLSSVNTEPCFSEKDFSFMKEMSNKLDRINENLTASQTKHYCPEKNQQLNDSSLMIDDYSTNATFAETFQKNKRNEKVRKITSYGNFKLF
jgi:hypothetical protein